MMFSCSKDDLINTEQESNSGQKNNHSVVSGELNSRGSMGIGTIMEFRGTSIENKKYENGALPTGRILLKQGRFSGSLSGIGKINSKLSIYDFSPCVELPIDSPPNYGEPLMYSVVAKGYIFIGTTDNCFVTITGNIYPWYYTEIGIDGGTFIGTATTISGVGKLRSLDNKKFKVYSYSNGSVPGINLETGTISLSISDFEYQNN